MWKLNHSNYADIKLEVSGINRAPARLTQKYGFWEPELIPNRESQQYRQVLGKMEKYLGE